MKTSPSPSVQELSFEDAIQELEGIVRKLEVGQVPLDDSISLYERGVELKNHCHEKLRSAQLKVEQIQAPLTQDDTPTLSDFLGQEES